MKMMQLDPNLCSCVLLFPYLSLFGDKFLNKTPIFNLKKVKDIKTVFFSKTKCRSHSVNECFIKHFATRINQVSFFSIFHELFCILFWVFFLFFFFFSILLEYEIAIENFVNLHYSLWWERKSHLLYYWMQ